jgi:hypothetical protein
MEGNREPGSKVIKEREEQYENKAPEKPSGDEEIHTH